MLRHQDTEAVKFVEELAAEVSSRLRGIGMKGRTLTLKLMVRRPDAPAETAKFMGRWTEQQTQRLVVLSLSGSAI